MKIIKIIDGLLIALLLSFYQSLSVLAATNPINSNINKKPTHLLGLLFPSDKQIIYEQYFEKFLKGLEYVPYVIVLGLILGIGYWGVKYWKAKN